MSVIEEQIRLLNMNDRLQHDGTPCPQPNEIEPSRQIRSIHHHTMNSSVDPSFEQCPDMPSITADEFCNHPPSRWKIEHEHRGGSERIGDARLQSERGRQSCYRS